MKKKLLMLIITAFSICSFLYSNDLKVAAVQLKISENTYSSYNQFWIEMEEHVNTAVNTFHPDLIIFPEYTSVFPSITPYYDYLQEGETVEEIFLAISDSNSRIKSIKDIFVEEADNIENVMSYWGKLAEKYSVTIVGGTYFAYEGGKLSNQLIVYGLEGERIYKQNKFFLTDFETDIIGLSPGSPNDQKGININGKQVVFTICRDSFLNRWESMYDGADLWIDIKANGVLFTEDQKTLFSRALPLRLKSSNVPYGATVCLTGKFLELFWEGESSFVKKTYDDVYPILTSKKVLSNEIIYFVIE